MPNTKAIDLNDKEYIPVSSQAPDYYKVKIISTTGQSIDGFTKEPPKFSLASEWANLFQGVVPGAGLMQKFSGDSSFTTGIMSQKYFKGGNALAVSVDFRVIHKDGDNNFTGGGKQLPNRVIQSAITLFSSVCSEPFTVEDKIPSDAQIEKYKNELPEKGKNAVIDVFKTTTDLARKAGAGEYKKVVGYLANKVEAIGNRSIRDKTVTLELGPMFSYPQMIVKDVSVTYSRDLTRTGPLYGDFSVSMETVRQVTKGNGRDGIEKLMKNRFSAGRVKFN